MRHIAVRAWSARVRVLGTRLSCAKTAELITEISFGGQTSPAGPKNHALDGVQIPRGFEGTLLRGRVPARCNMHCTLFACLAPAEDECLRHRMTAKEGVRATAMPSSAKPLRPLVIKYPAHAHHLTGGRIRCSAYVTGSIELHMSNISLQLTAPS